MSKYAGIDILKLYSGLGEGFEDDFRVADGAIHVAKKTHRMLRSHEKWNLWLEKCLQERNLPMLMDVRYRLQVGMDELVKKRMSNQKIAEMYARWLTSIDKTARRIIKLKHPTPKGFEKALEAKRKRDKEFEEFLRKSSY